VVDPGVLVSAAISPRGAPRELLVAWRSGRFRMVVSYDLLYELESVLLRPKFRRKLAYSDVLEYVMWIREGSEFEQRALAEVEISPDPDDDYLLALAFAPGADFLVTQDGPHLLNLPPGLGPFRIVHPREFVDELNRTR
jgi:putative PIN family toxin of toxin-antitoxin system